MWCISRILLIRDFWGWYSNSNPPPTAPGKHHAVCLTHLGTFQRINTSSAYRMIRIRGAVFFFNNDSLLLIGMSIDFRARQLKNTSVAVARCSPDNFWSFAGPLCQHFPPPQKQSAVKHLHKEWKCNHWPGKQNICMCIINQGTKAEQAVWGENSWSAADRASSLSVSCARQTGRASRSPQRRSH